MRRATPGQVCSLILHALVLAVLLHRPDAQILAPSLLQKGNGGHAPVDVYLSKADLRSALEEPTQVDPRPYLVSLPRARHKPKPAKQIAERESQVSNSEQKAGVATGTMYAGLLSGQDVRPALPEVYPDPPVAREEIPVGFDGDVVVEVTIDANGQVVATKLLQGVSANIEQKVLATVQQWKFKPATRDGVPIPSRQDVHFHYPS